jgi:hypothetical protein
MSELRAISIRQPWLDLILRGKKKIELREWNPTFRGPVALHAPMRIDFHAAHYFGYRDYWKLERGKVLGLANLTSVTELNEESYAKTLMEHLSVLPFASILYAISFSDILVLPKPIEAKGKRLLFFLDNETSEEISNQLPPNNMFNLIHLL